MAKHHVVEGLACLLIVATSSCWPQGAAAGLPETIVGELRAPESLPRGTYTAVSAWEAEKAPHKTGRLVEDPDAEGGQAWECRQDVDVAETMLFGPYLEVASGDYVAFFRIKLLETPESSALGSLDACVAYGQDMLTSRELEAVDLALNQYVQVPLGFRYDRGKLECRFHWYGFFGLRIDRVSLFRLEGGDLSRTPWRVPEAVPSGFPRDLAYYTEPRPFPDIFPRALPPDNELLVCDLRRERPDVRLCALALQGLANRRTPRVYCLLTPTDEKWLEYMKQRGWVTSTESVTLEELLRRYSAAINGAVITDPALPASRNVATMLCGVWDTLPVSPSLARRLGLTIQEDLRGRWKTSVEAYRWAFENLWPIMNHHVVACSWPDHLGLRDYLVQNKIFIFWLSGPLDGARPYASPDEEVRLVEEILAQLPVNMPVMSYPWAGKDVGIGEGPGVSLFAEFGKYLVGSIDTTNLSLHSGIQVPELKQKPAPPAPPLQTDKVYLSWIISDGDNLPVLTNGNFPQLWDQKERGEFPIGWTLSPSASVLIPDVVDYYYRTATPNDAFLGAVSGVGYTYPDLYGKRYREPDRQRVYDEFLEQTADYMQRTDLHELWVMNATRPEIISRFAEKIPFLNALFPDYGRRIANAEDATYATARNMPVFHAVTAWKMEATREERIADLVADIRRMTPPQRPAFLHAFALNWFIDLAMLQEVLEQLGPDYVAVRPDHLAQLWRQNMDREQIVLRFPRVGASLEGRPLVIRGSARNMTEDTQQVAIRLLEGLDAATVEPATLELDPAQEVVVSISGWPAGEAVELEVTTGAATRRVTIPLNRIPDGELVGEVPPDYRLSPSTYLEAEGLPHRSGAQEPDESASDGKTWVARVGEAEPGHIVFGPYAPLAPGKYVALFRLKRLDEGNGVAAVLDTCVGGGTPQTGLRQVLTDELPVGQWRSVPVVFDHPGGAFETRAIWSGVASLAVDRIAVLEVLR